MATETQIQAIIKKIAPYAQIYAEKYGYKVCSPCIAQALQESLGKYDGLSLLAFKYNNYHGIKAYPKWTGATVNMKTGEEVNNALVYVNSNFCIFENLADAIENYYLFLERNPRYKPVKNCYTPADYLTTIRACKYCTDTDYPVNCMNKVIKYNLTQYDTIKCEITYKASYTYTLQANLYVRDKANGEKLKYECITEDAKKKANFDEYGCAILNKGARVTCKAVEEIDGATWLQIPSGWICAKSKEGKIYIL